MKLLTRRLFAKLAAVSPLAATPAVALAAQTTTPIPQTNNLDDVLKYIQTMLSAFQRDCPTGVELRSSLSLHRRLVAGGEWREINTGIIVWARPLDAAFEPFSFGFGITHSEILDGTAYHSFNTQMMDLVASLWAETPNRVS